MSITRRTGKIKFWNESKGFGFIVPDEAGVNGGRDVFVHVTATGGRNLEKGEAVEFTLDIDKRTGKPAAFDVTGSGG